MQTILVYTYCYHRLHDPLLFWKLLWHHNNLLTSSVPVYSYTLFRAAFVGLHLPALIVATLSLLPGYLSLSLMASTLGLLPPALVGTSKQTASQGSYMYQQQPLTYCWVSYLIFSEYNFYRCSLSMTLCFAPAYNYVSCACVCLCVNTCMYM